MTPAERLEADLDASRRARELDARAEALLLEEHPERMAAIVPHQSDRTRWPRQQALRAIARETKSRARVLHVEADRLYWSFAERHQGFVHREALKHAKLSACEVATVLSRMQEGVYRAALAWEPERGSFATYARWLTRATWQRAEERQGAVHLSSHAMWSPQDGSFRRLRLDSLDAPLSTDSELTRLDALGDEDEELEIGPDVRRLRDAMARLEPRAREMVTRRAEGETLIEIGRSFGLSRERVRQIIVSAHRTLRRQVGAFTEGEVMEFRVKEHPVGGVCRLEGCEEKAAVRGLCKRHYGAASYYRKLDDVGLPALAPSSEPSGLERVAAACGVAVDAGVAEIVAKVGELVAAQQAWQAERGRLANVEAETKALLDDLRGIVGGASVEEILQHVRDLAARPAVYDEADLRRRVGLLDSAAELEAAMAEGRAQLAELRRQALS